MSYDVLDELRRRLVGPSDRAPNERRSDERPRGERAASAPLLADGGDRGDRGDRDDRDDHLRDLPDGAGCAEIWEHLSERQAEEGGATERRPRECRADD